MRDDPFASYRLDNLGGGHYHLKPTEPSYGGDVRISFLTGPHVAIYGDLCPGREKHDNKGLISVTGKGEGWFRGRLSGDYLAEKFGLEKVFRADKAESYCREQAEECDGGNAQRWSDLADEAENLDAADLEAVGAWTSDLYDLADDGEAIGACYGYDVDNLRLLMDIQRAFARLVS